MVEEIFSTGSEEELSSLAQSQLKENASEDSQQIIKTLAIINYLKVTVLVIIGFIILQQIYYRLFAKGNVQGGRRKPASRGQAGKRPFTRAEALLVMLENNGCPPEQLQTLRNTVTNQDVKNIPPEDFNVEQQKRSDRRKEINRPKRSVVFGLDNNKTREFKIADIVQSDERVIKSAERNQPLTPGRLVKLKPTVVEDRPVGSDDDQTATTEQTSNVDQRRASPATGGVAVAESGDFETQSGDGSANGERESGEEDQSQILPTLDDINTTSTVGASVNNNATVSNTQASQEESKVSSSASPEKKQSKKQKLPKFEEESKVHEEDPPSADEVSSTSTKDA